MIQTAKHANAAYSSMPMTFQRVSGVDEKSMSVRAVISTPTKDREGDILESYGADLSHHKNLPIVFFNHGLVDGVPGMAFPIGKAEDPNGNYTVRFDPPTNRLVATTWFAQNDPTAVQLFKFVADDILRGWSVGWLPIRVKKMLDRLPGRKRNGLHVDAWELKEYSLVGVPCNPEALRIKLDRGLDPHVEPWLKMALEPMAARSRA